MIFKLKEWEKPQIAVIVYTFFLFIITPYLPNLIRFTSQYWSSTSVTHFVLMVEITIAVFLFGFSGWIFVFHRSKFFLFFIGISSIFIITFIIYQFLPNPYEFTHLPEYGVLGFLLIKAVSKSAKSPYLQSFLYAVLIGTVDELYQGILPNRSCTWYDITLNAMGSILGLLIFWGFQKTEKI